jgi:hypothetical protein
VDAIDQLVKRVSVVPETMMSIASRSATRALPESPAIENLNLALA